MGSECTVCGERYPSTFYFAEKGLCKTCHGRGESRVQTPGEEAGPGSPWMTRRFWLGVGGNLAMFVALLLAFGAIVGAIAGTGFLGQTRGASGSVLILFFGLLQAALVLGLGLAVAAGFFTLRALDDDLRSRAAATPAPRD